MSAIEVDVIGVGRLGKAPLGANVLFEVSQRLRDGRLGRCDALRPEQRRDDQPQ